MYLMCSLLEEDDFSDKCRLYPPTDVTHEKRKGGQLERCFQFTNFTAPIVEQVTALSETGGSGGGSVGVRDLRLKEHSKLSEVYNTSKLAEVQLRKNRFPF